MSNNLTNSILAPISEGKGIAIYPGTMFTDFTVMDNNIVPQLEVLKKQAFQLFGQIVIRYSLTTGIQTDLTEFNQNEKQKINQFLEDNALILPRNNDNRTPGVVSLLNAVQKLCSSPNKLLIRDREIKFFIMIEFSEHLFPQLHQGTQNLEQLSALETVINLSRSLALRKSGNFVAILEYDLGKLDNRLYSGIPTIQLPFPDKSEKQELLDALKKRYPNAEIPFDLQDEYIIQLNSGTLNRSLESAFLASEKTKTVLSAHDIFKRKQSDIITFSEGTIEPIDTYRNKNSNLTGRTIEKPRKILQSIFEGLKRSDPSTLRFVILAGGPSSGKTALLMSEASSINLPAFLINTPKAMYVGESERRMRNMLNLFKNSGGIGIVDEIEMAFPLDRNQKSHDSGVSENLTGQLQTFLSDPSIAGKCFMAGTTNRPSNLSEAMRQRFVMIPVISAIKEDYPAIVHAITCELNPLFSENENHPVIVSAANKFYNAGAPPREIREALIIAQMLFHRLDLEEIEFASNDIRPAGSRLSTIYSDYCALSYCRSQSFLPWWNTDKQIPDPDFPYPDYIQEILNDDLTINSLELMNRINEMKGHVNV